MSDCVHCDFLNTVFFGGKLDDSNNKKYWEFTEMFCYLHGSDVCDGTNKPETVTKENEYWYKSMKEIIANKNAGL